MAKRSSGARTPRTGEGVAATGAPAGGVAEQRLVALAERLGRIAGRLQAKADDWLDKDALTAQIVAVRDGAAELLTQVTASARTASTTVVKKAAKAVPKKTAAKAPSKRAAKKPAGATARSAGEGRSGGTVDARGKKHRKPLPGDPGASLVDSQAAKMRAAMPMTKTPRRRGRA